MTKQEFIKIISQGLSDFPDKELKDILYDYEEHISSAIAYGKSEAEILEDLGDPYVIVNQYRSGYIQKVKIEEPDFEEVNSDDTSYNSSSNYSSNNNSSSNNQSNNNDNNTANTVLKIGILICGLVFLGPIAFGGVASIFALVIAFLSVPFALSISGVTVLLSKLGLNVLGFSAPAFIMDFPDSVLVLVTLGSIASTILMIIVSVYFVKAVIVLIKKLITKFSTKGVN